MLKVQVTRDYLTIDYFYILYVIRLSQYLYVTFIINIKDTYYNYVLIILY